MLLTRCETLISILVAISIRLLITTCIDNVYRGGVCGPKHGIVYREVWPSAANKGRCGAAIVCTPASVVWPADRQHGSGSRRLEQSQHAF